MRRPHDHLRATDRSPRSPCVLHHFPSRWPHETLAVIPRMLTAFRANTLRVSLWTRSTHLFLLHRFLSRWTYTQISSSTPLRRHAHTPSPTPNPPPKDSKHDSNPHRVVTRLRSNSFIESAPVRASRCPGRYFPWRASDKALTFIGHNPTKCPFSMVSVLTAILKARGHDNTRLMADAQDRRVS